MSHAGCVHELSIKLSLELLRISENITPYLFSWNSFSDHNCWDIEPETFDRRYDVVEENRKEFF